MEEYTCMIPRDTYDGAFYRAVLALHDDQYPLAQQCIDKARDILDTDLTAMAGESYNRAYGVCLNVFNFKGLYHPGNVQAKQTVIVLWNALFVG